MTRTPESRSPTSLCVQQGRRWAGQWLGVDAGDGRLWHHRRVQRIHPRHRHKGMQVRRSCCYAGSASSILTLLPTTTGRVGTTPSPTLETPRESLIGATVPIGLRMSVTGGAVGRRRPMRQAVSTTGTRLTTTDDGEISLMMGKFLCAFAHSSCVHESD
jgi:hypothetical protein